MPQPPPRVVLLHPSSSIPAMAELDPPVPPTIGAAEMSSSGSAATSAHSPDAGMGTASRAQKRRRLDGVLIGGEGAGDGAPSVDHAALIMEAGSDEAEEADESSSKQQLKAAARGAGSRWGADWGRLSSDTADEQAPLLWAAEAKKAAAEQEKWVAEAHAADRARPRRPKQPAAFSGVAVAIDI